MIGGALGGHEDRNVSVRNSPFLLLARVGFAARGFMYLLVAWMALRLGRTEDPGAALEYLGTGSGRLVLAAMAVGFAGYSAWRLTDAALNTDGDSLGHRIAAAASGVIHLGFGFTAAKLALGERQSGTATAETGAADVMDLPGGEALLYAVAAALLGGAAFQFIVAVRRRFLRRMAPEAARRWWIVAAGVAGYATRGILFAMAAWLMFRAASDHVAAEAGGLGDALHAVPASLRAAVAAGLALFGTFSLLEARYRVISDPHVEDRIGSLAG
jgi:hypothetical protein